MSLNMIGYSWAISSYFTVSDSLQLLDTKTLVWCAWCSAHNAANVLCRYTWCWPRRWWCPTLGRITLWNAVMRSTVWSLRCQMLTKAHQVGNGLGWRAGDLRWENRCWQLITGAILGLVSVSLILELHLLSVVLPWSRKVFIAKHFQYHSNNVFNSQDLYALYLII